MLDLELFTPIPSKPQITEMPKWFSSPGFRELGVRSSRFEIIVSSRSQISKCQNAKTLLQRYFAFHNFRASYVEHSTPCQQECGNANSQNSYKYPAVTCDFHLSSPLFPDHSSSVLVVEPDYLPFRGPCF
jgi:hypothetical protein